MTPSSPSYAINAAVGGGDLVVEGPPGTGKSQTIANLIATLAARGQRVLFVAEKRAAIDAVLDRLDKLGLADLVLDLHDGVGSKRKLAQDLARSLTDASSIARPELASLQDTLVRRRQELIAHDQAMHERRQPWDIWVYDILCRRLEAPERSSVATPVNVDVLTGTVYSQARHDLREYANRGGLRLSPASSPWAGLAAGTIPTAAQAEAALTAASTLSGHTWPQASARLDHLADECGFRHPSGVEGWAALFDLLRLAAATGSVFDGTLFDLPLAEVAMAVAPAGRNPFGRGFRSCRQRVYRAARKQLRAVCPPRQAGAPGVARGRAPGH